MSYSASYTTENGYLWNCSRSLIPSSFRMGSVPPCNAEAVTHLFPAARCWRQPILLLTPEILHALSDLLELLQAAFQTVLPQLHYLCVCSSACCPWQHFSCCSLPCAVLCPRFPSLSEVTEQDLVAQWFLQRCWAYRWSETLWGGIFASTRGCAWLAV